MRFGAIMSGLCALGCGPCSQSAPASYEKGGPVTEVGFVSLSPPTSYSPERGVICESYSIAEDGSATGECYDLSGPSVELTETHISPQAAKKLQADIDAGRFDNPRRFNIKIGLVCDFDLEKCWFQRDDEAIVEAPKHSKAMF